MTTRPRGGQAGNRNPVKLTRKRVNLEICLSDTNEHSRLAPFVEMGRKKYGREPTTDEVREIARPILYAYLDTLSG